MQSCDRGELAKGEKQKAIIDYYTNESYGDREKKAFIIHEYKCK